MYVEPKLIQNDAISSLYNHPNLRFDLTELQVLNPISFLYIFPSEMSAPAARLKRVSTVPATYNKLPSLITLPQSSSSKLVLGRGNTADILLTSTQYPVLISRHHAEITIDDETNKHVITDSNSKNGLYVNDIRVKSAELMHGDLVCFGGSEQIKLGQHFPQPNSEFIYQYITDNTISNNNNIHSKESEEEDSTAFDTMKAITENVSVVFTWLGLLFAAGSYLFADEKSEEYSYIVDYIKPIFDLIGIPFTRATFVISFIISFTLFLWICFKIWGPKTKVKTKK